MTPGRRAVALGAVWILLGFAMWGAGVIGIAVGLEDRCLEVAVERDYGASSQSASIWPPRFTCELTGPEAGDAAVRVDSEQLDAALLRTGWAIGFPVAWSVLGAVVRVRGRATDRNATP